MSPTTTDRTEAVAGVREAFMEMQSAARRLKGRDATHKDDLSFAQYFLLRQLDLHDELPASRLAAAAGLAPATVTHMIDTLARHELVERAASESDRRLVLVRLTPEGRRRLDRKREAMFASWDRSLGDLDPSELESLRGALGRIAELLDAL